MERRNNNNNNNTTVNPSSGSQQRTRRLHEQFYHTLQSSSSASPPTSELHLQPLSRVPAQIYQLHPAQAQLFTRPTNNNSHNIHDLNELAHKLDVKNGGLPPGSFIGAGLKQTMGKAHTSQAPKSSTSSGGSSNTNHHNNNDNLQRGERIVQRGFKFSDDQRRRLNESFAYSRYPKPEDMDVLAYELNVRREQIKNWFHDQRRKYKNIVIVKKASSNKKTMFSAQQRKRLEEFFEKNFHPYPGDSKKLVNEFEFNEEQSVHFRYEEVPMRYDCMNTTNERGSQVPQSRGFKFSEDQRIRLRAYFNKNRYPNPYDMERLAQELHVKKEQIKNWFHDQRRKLKRENSIR